ncbi:MAG: triose-phosphate isomerase [Marinifilaceae bacterium]
MRKKIVAGNWKMNNTLQEGIALAKELNEKVLNENTENVTIVIGTPFIHLNAVKEVVSGKINVSAQNCANHASGAYTGEISAAMIASTGANHVILGHSERRSYYGETDAILVEKVALALANKLTVIFCIGEVLEEREEGRHFDVVKSQLENGLFNLTEEQLANIVIAYEPVWAIGTGKTATAEQAQEIHAYIRSVIAGKYGKDAADKMAILYGGSCNAKNADELFANPDVDGGLIGGASLNAEDFMAIIRAAAKK